MSEGEVEQHSLGRLIDREQIGLAMAEYARGADLNLPDRQAQVFTDDCRVSYHPDSWIEGRAVLADYLRESLARFQRTSHHLGNIEIRFDGADSASADSSVIAWHRRTDGTEWTLYGRYVDRWVRGPDGWRMSQRVLRAAGATGRDEGQLPALGRA